MNINDPNHPVILFIPEAGIYPYMRGLAVLGEAVTKCGGRVLVAHDTGQMLRSPIMAMYKTSVSISAKEKNKIHSVTERNIRQVLRKYKFSAIELSNLVDSQLIKEIDSLADNAGENLKKISYKGFPVGQIAEFDFILETKFPYYSNLSRQHKELYLQYIKNTALAIAVTNNICEKYNPSMLLTFNEYAQCQAVRYSAETYKVRHMTLTYPVHFNIDSSKFLIWKSSYRRWMTDHIRKWNGFKNTPVAEKHAAASWDDSIFRMYGTGSHIFSMRKKKDPGLIFSELQLDSKRKTIIVYTSSQEERRCAEIAMKAWGENNPATDVFPNHIEWLSMLRDYSAKKDDVQIVVRVHPREGFRQFGFDSQHLRKLKARFKKNTPNFKIVWPDDPISSYDLMELADVCLISWSTIGQEAARVGIPVLSCVGNMYYPNDDFIQVAANLKEYKEKLDSILKMDYKWEHLVKAIRFYHWRTFIPSLDLGKAIPADFDDHSVWPKAPPSATKVINDILSGENDPIKYNIRKWQESLSAGASRREAKVIKEGIRRFLDNIFYPPRNTDMIFRLWRYAWRKITGNSLWVPKRSLRDYRLEYTEDLSQMDSLIKKTKDNPKLRVLVRDGLRVVLVNKGRLLHRVSPMVIRLARLHNNA
jgi:hypothetical protein